MKIDNNQDSYKEKLKRLRAEISKIENRLTKGKTTTKII